MCPLPVMHATPPAACRRGHFEHDLVRVGQRPYPILNIRLLLLPDSISQLVCCISLVFSCRLAKYPLYQLLDHLLIWLYHFFSPYHYSEPRPPFIEYTILYILFAFAVPLDVKPYISHAINSAPPRRSDRPPLLHVFASNS